MPTPRQGQRPCVKCGVPFNQVRRRICPACDDRRHADLSETEIDARFRTAKDAHRRGELTEQDAWQSRPLPVPPDYSGAS